MWTTQPTLSSENFSDAYDSMRYLSNVSNHYGDTVTDNMDFLQDHFHVPGRCHFGECPFKVNMETSQGLVGVKELVDRVNLRMRIHTYVRHYDRLFGKAMTP